MDTSTCSMHYHLAGHSSQATGCSHTCLHNSHATEQSNHAHTCHLHARSSKQQTLTVLLTLACPTKHTDSRASIPLCAHRLSLSSSVQTDLTQLHYSANSPMQHAIRSPPTSPNHLTNSSPPTSPNHLTNSSSPLAHHPTINTKTPRQIYDDASASSFCSPPDSA